jgi:hypothetical protein
MGSAHPKPIQDGYEVTLAELKMSSSSDPTLTPPHQGGLNSNSPILLGVGGGSWFSDSWLVCVNKNNSAILTPQLKNARENEGGTNDKMGSFCTGQERVSYQIIGVPRPLK